MSIIELLFGKRKTYDDYVGEAHVKTMSIFKRLQDYLGVRFSGLYAENGCPLCGGTLKDNYACRWVQCENLECGLQIIYDDDFDLDYSIESIEKIKRGIKRNA